MGIYIGIPTINNIKYLQETLNSIKDIEDSHILIVDNGSTDITYQWVVACQYEKILNGSNLGVSKAWNQILNWGISHDDCNVVYVLNNDIVLHSECLTMMNESVLENGKDAISGLNIGNLPVMLNSFTKPTLNNRYSPAMNFSCFGLTLQTIKRVGLFDEGFKRAYFEDNDFHHRMNLEGIVSSCDQFAAFTHYGSRSIKEGGVKHEPYFTQNRNYFKQKWGFSPDGR